MLAAVDIAYNGTRHFRNFFHQIWICTKTDLRFQAAKVKAPSATSVGSPGSCNPNPMCPSCVGECSRSTIYVSRNGCHDWIGDHSNEFAAAVESFAMREMEDTGR